MRISGFGPCPLIFFRLIQFGDEQHRDITRLRPTEPELFLEIHPETAKTQGIDNCAWLTLETPNGKVAVTAKFNDSLHPSWPPSTAGGKPAGS